MPVEKSAGAIIFFRQPDKIEYLLIQNSSNKTWVFPKGLIEKGEDVKQAALRETQEETGLKDLRLIDGFKETIRYFMKVKYDYQIKEHGLKLGQIVLKFVTYFLAESFSKEVKLSFEHDDFGWFSFEEAAEKLKKTRSNLDVLRKADDYLRIMG
ncbi:MAG: NUDIX domain-containing protein [Candidatus Portnoybacteria bacterium]|nr:NUDIX domain-containing protein [Candidatus Portnoybacteria bacterium]